MSTTHLVWLATADPGVRRQALYSLYSALAFRGAVQVTLHLYTDDPHSYQPLAKLITIHELDHDAILSLGGPQHLPYRMKVAALANVMRAYGSDRVMFMDADTFFFREFGPLLRSIDKRNAVMHRLEWQVASAATGQMRRFRRNMARVRFRGAGINLAVDMWNSGVIGIDASCLGVLEEALEFADAVWKDYRKPFVEQFAVSAFLQNAGMLLHPAEDFVFHYWYQKIDYQVEIEERLPRWQSLPVEAALEEIRQNRIVLPAPPRKLHLWERIQERVSGRPVPDVRGLAKPDDVR